VDIKLEKPQIIKQQTCGFSSFVSTYRALHCSDIGVLTRCPPLEFSLSCPLHNTLVLAPVAARPSGGAASRSFRHVTRRNLLRLAGRHDPRWVQRIAPFHIPHHGDRQHPSEEEFEVPVDDAERQSEFILDQGRVQRPVIYSASLR
jgi:hypothetical protein